MRLLARQELPLIWTIDRREFIEYVYRLRDGQLVLDQDTTVADYKGGGVRPGRCAAWALGATRPTEPPIPYDTTVARRL
jgi:hypothetical protein